MSWRRRRREWWWTYSCTQVTTWRPGSSSYGSAIPIGGPMAEQPIRIANCSGFYGDRLSAAREMVDGGPIDVLTGDWLAELTMLILAKDKLRDPDGGYAKTFVTQMRDVLATCQERGIKVVANAGGLNPAGCARTIEAIIAEQGLDLTVAYVEGDDLVDRIEELRTK